MYFLFLHAFFWKSDISGLTKVKIIPKQHNTPSQNFYQLSIHVLPCFWLSFEACVHDRKKSTTYFVRISLQQIEIFYDKFGVLNWATIKAEVKLIIHFWQLMYTPSNHIIIVFEIYTLLAVEHFWLVSRLKECTVFSILG